VTVKVECDGPDCEEDVLESKGLQLHEGEVFLDAGSPTVKFEDVYGVFCSIDCLQQFLTEEVTGGENQ